MTRFACLAASLLAFQLIGTTTLLGDEPSQDDINFFEKHIRPLLVNHCYECHSEQADDIGGNLLLDRKAGWEEGGDLGPAIIPGNPEKSLLIRAVRYVECDLQMPPSGKLSDEELKALEEWIERGAPDPRTEEKRTAKPPTIDIESGRQHWAFQPLSSPTLPQVQDASWPQSPIDYFVLAGLEANHLQPAPPADKRTLIRRATFDLTGLPPTSEEVHAFLADESPDAFARLVDRLLASPHYGERWGRHWLDVARYADSNGLDENIAHGNAWRYRDWVVSAFNQDLSFSDFVAWQIAGDLLPAEDESRRREQLIATGFLVLGPKVLAESDEQKMRMDIVDEQIDTVGRSLLGLTLGCARCHDHKFDPIPTSDYYALAGVFCSTRTMETYKRIARWYEHSMPTPEEQELQRRHLQSIEAKKSEIETVVQAANEQLLSMLESGAPLPQDAESKYPEETKTKLKTLRDEVAKLEKSPPEVSSAMGVTEGEVADVAVHIRGSHLNLGDVVPRRFPQVLTTHDSSLLPADQSGRLQLAQWMTDPAHPLTRRVFVNRLWRWRFGEGVVPSTDNFGLLGEKPTNLPLLDFLAQRLIDEDGSVKAMHRLMMLSSTYQMSGQFNAQAANIDPTNRLLWRRTPQRLEAESVRDSLLFVSQKLDSKMGGSLLHVKNREFLFDHTSKDQTKYDHRQRSLYLPVIRNNVYDALELFDFPDPAVLNGDRATTTVAPQALFLMNSEVAWDAMLHMAEGLLADNDLSDRTRVTTLYETTLGRPADDREIDRALAFVGQYASDYVGETSQHDVRRHAWRALCLAVIASNEFIYIK